MKQPLTNLEKRIRRIVLLRLKKKYGRVIRSRKQAQGTDCLYPTIGAFPSVY